MKRNPSELTGCDIMADVTWQKTQHRHSSPELKEHPLLLGDKLFSEEANDNNIRDVVKLTEMRRLWPSFTKKSLISW